MICKNLIDIHGKVCFHQKDDLLHYFLTNHLRVLSTGRRNIQFVFSCVYLNVYELGHLFV